MRSHIYIASSADTEREAILNRLDQRTLQQISANSLETLSRSCQPVASPLSLAWFKLKTTKQRKTSSQAVTLTHVASRRDQHARSLSGSMGGPAGL